MIPSFKWWHGDARDIPLSYVRQIPGVRGLVTYFDTPPGEVIPLEEMLGMRARVQEVGLELAVIESIPVHDEIKAGGPRRDEMIDAYCQSVRHAGEAGVPVVCYNFMPVFDWLRTDLAKVMADGSTCLAVDDAIVQRMTPEDFVRDVGRHIPGWDVAELGPKFRAQMALFDDVDSEALWANLAYFLDAVAPVAEASNVKLGIHPDDPPWPVFGLPRIITNKASYDRLFAINKSPAHGATVCSGSLGADPDNNVGDIIRHIDAIGGRIHFAHVRNVKHLGYRTFDESPHLSSTGSLDIYDILLAFHEVGFSGPIRPDHGRMIWGEQQLPGYGLYDRAIGISYLQGVWEAITKGEVSRRD